MSQVVRGKLDEDAVAGEYADEIHADFSGNVGQDAVTVGELDAEHCVRQRLNDRPLDLNRLFLGRCGRGGARFVLAATVGSSTTTPVPSCHLRCHLLSRTVFLNVFVLVGVA
jgi:hypothetical protein